MNGILGYCRIRGLLARLSVSAAWLALAGDLSGAHAVSGYAGPAAGSERVPGAASSMPSGNYLADDDDPGQLSWPASAGYCSAAPPTSQPRSSDPQGSVTSGNGGVFPVTLSGSSLRATSLAYTTAYNPRSLAGSLSAKPVGLDGKIGASQWEAGSLLTRRDLRADPRILVTSSGPGSGPGIVFSWASLTPAEQTMLNSADGSGRHPDGHGAARVGWLSGLRRDEGRGVRTRTSLLGAMFRAQPVYVAAPDAGLSDDFPRDSPEAKALTSSRRYAYSSFVAAHAARAPVVYVFANDGILHAFDGRLAGTAGAAPGRELWGFVPSSIYAHLPALSEPTGHDLTPVVDGPLVHGEVFFARVNRRNGSSMGWHTILVGVVGSGSGGIYAIDVTDPANMISTSKVAGQVLWELNGRSVGAADSSASRAYTFGAPSIGRLANGCWAVLVPASHVPNHSQPALHTYSSLLVIDAQAGTLLKEIRTPSGVASDGLATVVLGDYDGDQVADVGFAGDLAGNLWRFDLAAADLDSRSPNAGVSRIFAAARTGVRSITTQPRLVADPTSPYFMVVFGSGRSLSKADSADDTIQGIAGIRDPGPIPRASGAWSEADLVAQTMLVTPDGAIGVSSHAVPGSSGGWYLPLNQRKGERVVVNPYLQVTTDTVVFSTLMAASDGRGTTSLTASILVLDASSGSAALGNHFSGSDLAAGYTVAGSRLGTVATAGSLGGASGAGGSVYFPGLIASGVTSGTVSIEGPTRRRRSWRILNNDEN